MDGAVVVPPMLLLQGNPGTVYLLTGIELPKRQLVPTLNKWD